MKKIILGIFLALLLFTKVDAKVLVVPIQGEINSAKTNFVGSSIKNLTNEDTVVFKIDTYGGSIASAEEIKNSIIRSKAKTISVVDNKAESAGVLLTIASEEVYMVEGSTIGSAETIPNTEKTLSYWRSILSDTAARRGRNMDVIVAMADSDVVIENIVEKGKLLNLNAEKSKDLGISDYTYKDFDEFLTENNIVDYELAKMNFGMKFLDFISSQVISSLLLIIGMSALVVELFMPGFGVGGVLSIIAFGLFFAGNIFAGSASWYAMAIFVLGLVLIFIEIMMPGFGVAGISGIISLVLGVIFAMGSLEVAIKSLSLAIIVTFGIGMFMVKKGMKTNLFNNLKLDNSLSSEEGFLSVDTAKLNVGDVCLTKTVMKPTGFIEYMDVKYEAISVDGYIDKNVEVEVSKVEKSKVYVRRVI